MAGRIDGTTKALLAVIAGALVVIAASSIFGGGSGGLLAPPPAWATVNPAEQRVRMIRELETLNASADRILALLESGKLEVVMEKK